MDKYEYQLKLDQINKLIERNDYATALKIADNIDWRRVRSVNTLSKIADIYEKNGKYEESRDLLVMAYERAPVGRMIAYRLADLSVKLEDYDQAIEYYKDFVHSAPKDPGKLILKYKIFRGKGAALKDQIAILEEYRSVEYEEKWALELAYRYQEAGEIEKCVNECDELILWFNDGQYVLKAMELKMQYAELTPAQQEKYEIRMSRTKLVDAKEEPGRKAEDSAQDAYGQGTYGQTEMYDQGAYGQAEMYDQSGYAGEEYAQDAYGQQGMYQEGYQQGYSYPAQDELPEIQEPDMSMPEDVLRIEDDGQMTLEMPEYQPVEKQITGQMTIQEILAEWEKAKQPLKEETTVAEAPEETTAAEAPEETTAAEAPEEMTGEQGEDELPEIAMPEGLEEQGEELTEVPAEVPTEKEADEAAAKADVREDKEDAFIEEESAEEAATEEPIEEVVTEESAEEAPEETVGVQSEDELPEIAMPEGVEVPEEEEATDEAVAEAIEEEAVVEEPEEKAEVSAGEELEELPEIAMPEGLEEPTAEDELPEIELPEELLQEEAEEEAETDTEAESYEEDYEAEEYDGEEVEEEDGSAGEDEDAADDLESRIVNSLSRDSLVLADADDGQLDGRIGGEEIRRPQRRRSRDAGHAHGELTEEQKKLFSYFTPVHGMSDQLWTALENERGCIRGGTSNIGNIMIMGETGTGKTKLAVDLVKAIQKSRNAHAGRLAKISAETLNQKDVSAVVKKLNGGALIVERASELTNETAIRLEVAMRSQTGELLFLFEDEKQALKRFMKLHPKLAAMFTTKIDIPIFNNDELVEFGKCYAYELEYSIDEMAVLALYNRIGNMQRDDYDVSVTDVKKIIDAAIEKNEKGSVGKFFSLLTKKRYDEDDCIILKEKDFEE